MLKNRRSSEEIRYWQELRRSNASAKHTNKTKYNRKIKHKNSQETLDK